MTNRRFFHKLAAVLAIFLALSIGLLGCGGSSGTAFNGAADKAAPQMSSSMAASSAPAPAPMEPEEGAMVDWSYTESDTGGGGEVAFRMPDSRKIIRRASMELETREFEAALRSIQQAVAAAGGYIESQSQNGYSYGSRSRYQERYASISARVPSEKLDGVMQSVGGVCNVLSQSENIDDITDSYYDAQAHLRTLQIQEERLLEILSKAEKLEDIITLESALSDVRYQIESLTASLRRMDSQVTYSFLNLSIQEVVEYQTVQEKPRTFGQRMGDAFSDGLGDMVDGLQEFAVWLARVGPSLLVWVVIIAAVVLIVRACVKASARRRQAKGLPPRGPSATYTTAPGAAQPRFQRYPQQPPAQPQPGQEPEQPEKKD